MSVSFRALCLEFLCFHRHSGFERIFNNSFLLPLPEMGYGGADFGLPRRSLGALGAANLGAQLPLFSWISWLSRPK